MKINELRQFALSLPSTIEEPHFNSTSFRVKGRIFVTVPPEEQYAHIFVDDERRELAIRLYPEFVEILMWGKKVAGIRILLAKAKTTAVEDLVLSAWKRKAPKSLLKTTV